MIQPRDRPGETSPNMPTFPVATPSPGHQFTTAEIDSMLHRYIQALRFQIEDLGFHAHKLEFFIDNTQVLHKVFQTVDAIEGHLSGFLSMEHAKAARASWA